MTNDKERCNFLVLDNPLKKKRKVHEDCADMFSSNVPHLKFMMTNAWRKIKGTKDRFYCICLVLRLKETLRRCQEEKEKKKCFSNSVNSFNVSFKFPVSQKYRILYTISAIIRSVRCFCPNNTKVSFQVLDTLEP